jgi:AcrR family transcriptional regulator
VRRLLWLPAPSHGSLTSPLMRSENGASAIPAEERRHRMQTEQARRILAAARRSMGRRGLAGSTFDHVTREAEVSRGSVFYYFGTKERLVLELVRTDSELRVDTLRAAVEPARSAEEVLRALAGVYESFVGDACAQTLLYEMVASAPRHTEVQRALSGLYSEWRVTLGSLLTEKAAQEVLVLGGAPEGCAAALTALGEGLALQRAADPDWDSTAALLSVTEAARVLLGVPSSSSS